MCWKWISELNETQRMQSKCAKQESCERTCTVPAIRGHVASENLPIRECLVFRWISAPRIGAILLGRRDFGWREGEGWEAVARGRDARCITFCDSQLVSIQFPARERDHSRRNRPWRYRIGQETEWKKKKKKQKTEGDACLSKRMYLRSKPRRKNLSPVVRTVSVDRQAIPIHHLPFQKKSFTHPPPLPLRPPSYLPYSSFPAYLLTFVRSLCSSNPVNFIPKREISKKLLSYTEFNFFTKHVHYKK